MTHQNGTGLFPYREGDPRWSGIARPYGVDDVMRLRGTVRIEYTLARKGAERLWDLLHTDPYVPALGALTGNQAVEQVQAGLKAIYLSGWQVAGDANLAGQMYPDQSLYPANSVPRPWCGRSITRCCGPIRFIILRGATACTGWRRLWPTRRRVSEAR